MPRLYHEARRLPTHLHQVCWLEIDLGLGLQAAGQLEPARLGGLQLDLLLLLGRSESDRHSQLQEQGRESLFGSGLLNGHLCGPRAQNPHLWQEQSAAEEADQHGELADVPRRRR